MPVQGAKVSAKFCEPGRDSLLSDMDPKSRMGFFVPGYFVKVSYPVDRSFYYGTGSMNSDNAAKIQELKPSGRHVLVDKEDEHKDKMLIEGDKVYVVPNSYEGFKCVEGC